MRRDFSLAGGGLAAVAAALGAGGILLFSAGLLVGTASAAREPALAAETPAADSLAAFPAAGPCPPAVMDDSSAAPAAGPAAAGDRPAPVAVFRDERRALALRARMNARGGEAVVQAELAPDGEPVFRVLPAAMAWNAVAP
jgi:hypothetical protein